METETKIWAVILLLSYSNPSVCLRWSLGRGGGVGICRVKERTVGSICHMYRNVSATNQILAVTGNWQAECGVAEAGGKAVSDL